MFSCVILLSHASQACRKPHGPSRRPAAAQVCRCETNANQRPAGDHCGSADTRVGEEIRPSSADGDSISAAVKEQVGEETRLLRPLVVAETESAAAFVFTNEKEKGGIVDWSGRES